MAAATVRYNSSDDSTKSHAITGGSYDGPGKTTVSILNQGRDITQALGPSHLH